jgi:hypothetical protein
MAFTDEPMSERFEDEFAQALVTLSLALTAFEFYRRGVNEGSEQVDDRAECQSPD